MDDTDNEHWDRDFPPADYPREEGALPAEQTELRPFAPRITDPVLRTLLSTRGGRRQRPADDVQS